MAQKKQPSLIEFQKCFPNKTACAVLLFEKRWPEGFVCPKCKDGRAAEEAGRTPMSASTAAGGPR